MDAQNPSSTPTFASSTPVHIGAIGLAVRDLPGMTAFYQRLLGLTLQQQTATGARLGVGDVPIIHLTTRPGLKPDDPAEAGLYHTAFLMPTRADLARWLLKVAQDRTPITGASDHSVSEAIYLDDPEGNGIEVYSDRPQNAWIYNEGLLKISTDPLDIDDLVQAGQGAEPYIEAPGGFRIGHVHLRVGDTAAAADFYHGVVGLDVITRLRHGAVFLSSGGYHHHIGSNVWHSRGAGRRDETRAGLDWFSFGLADDATEQALRQRLKAANLPATDAEGGFETSDPWGTRVRFTRG